MVVSFWTIAWLLPAEQIHNNIVRVGVSKYCSNQSIKTNTTAVVTHVEVTWPGSKAFEVRYAWIHSGIGMDCFDLKKTFPVLMIVAPPLYKPITGRLDLKATKKSRSVYVCNVMFCFLFLKAIWRWNKSCVVWTHLVCHPYYWQGFSYVLFIKNDNLLLK